MSKGKPGELSSPPLKNTTKTKPERPAKRPATQSARWPGLRESKQRKSRPKIDIKSAARHPSPNTRLFQA
jgi:hypothetical protein